MKKENEVWKMNGGREEGLALVCLWEKKAIDFEVHCWRKKGKIYPNEKKKNRLNRMCWERGGKELNLS